jgi:hypothetical protein
MEEKRSARERKQNRNERNIEVGRKMLRLKFAGKPITKDAAILMAVADAFGSKPEIYRRISWRALIELSSPALPLAAREALEARIRAGEHVGAPAIRSIRGALRTDRTRPQAEPAGRMAA